MILINPLVGIHFTVPFLQQKKKNFFWTACLTPTPLSPFSLRCNPTSFCHIISWTVLVCIINDLPVLNLMVNSQPLAYLTFDTADHFLLQQISLPLSFQGATFSCFPSWFFSPEAHLCKLLMLKAPGALQLFMKPLPSVLSVLWL